jgi:N-methylhydantoinase B
VETTLANLPPVDGVRLAVINSRLQRVVRSMMNTLFRTARSGVINTARDFSCCIVTEDDELLAFAESLPIHVMSGADLLSKSIKEFHPVLSRGDAFLHNSPYHGNSHAADYSVLVPVIDDQGVHRYTVLAKAHQADCGNSVPTTYMAWARDVYEEGALIFPAVKIQEDYETREDIVRMCEARIRVPDQWRGDFFALLGAARIGERRLLELGNELGWDVLASHTQQWFDYSEARMAEAIGKLPSGRITTTGVHDPFPGVPDGIPVTVTLTVRSEEGIIEIDLRDNPDCLPCGLNLTESTARTNAMVGVFNGIDPIVPPNGGSFRRLLVHVRENCAVGIPRHPASCSAATTNLGDRVANCVQRAIAELGDGIGMAEAGLTRPASTAVISGLDPRHNGAPFCNQIFLATTGGAGGQGNDGWLTVIHASAAGALRRDSVEVDELRHPIRIHAEYIIPDSEGAGTLRGAPGAYAEYGPVDCSLEVMYTSDGTLNPALGARGGQEGSPARQYKRSADGRLTPAEACGRVVLSPGESIVSISCGGGGLGPPMARDPLRVRHDVIEAWVTRERARVVYGVVVGEEGEGEIDWSKTKALRAEALDDAPAEERGL